MDRHSLVEKARLWQYEEAVRQAANHKVTQLVTVGGYPSSPVAEWLKEGARLLGEAETECENTGEISPETRSQISKHPRLRGLWWNEELGIDITLKEKEREIANGIAKARNISVSEAKALLCKDPESLPEYKKLRREGILQGVRERERRDWWDSRELEIQSDYGLQGIPDGYHLDKIIRYGNWVERALDRAYDRLEEIQRRRRERELLASPVNVHLTQ